MLSSQQTNSDFADANQLQQNQQQSKQNKFTESVKGFLKESVKGFSKLPAQKQMLAVGAVGAIVSAALPLLTVVLVTALPGAAVALTFFLAVKVVSYAIQGMKWSADMVVKGAKHSAEQIEVGAKKVKEVYKHSTDSLKKGASRTASAVADTLYNAAGATNYLQKIKDFTSEQKEKSQEVRDELNIIFNDKGNNARLIENILSKMESTIDSKITSKKAEEFTSSLDDYVNNNTLIGRWNEQKKFISALDTGKLQNLLTKRSLPKDSYFIDSIFSEHYDQIKKIIPECKTTHLQISTFRNDTPSLKKEDRTLQESRKIRSEISYGEVDDAEAKSGGFSSIVSSLSKKKKTSNSPDSDSVKTDRTDSTVSSEAGLLNLRKHKKVEQTTSLGSKMSSWFRSNKVADSEVTPEFTYRSLSDQDLDNITTIGANRSRSSTPPRAVASPTVPKQRLDSLGSNISHSNSTNSVNSVASDASFLSASSKLSGSESANSFSYRRHSDSGVSSPGSSTPKRSSSMRNINSPHLSQIQEAKKSLKKTGSFEKLVPSSRVTTQAEVHAQPTQVAASQVSVKG